MSSVSGNQKSLILISTAVAVFLTAAAYVMLRQEDETVSGKNRGNQNQIAPDEAVKSFSLNASSSRSEDHLSVPSGLKEVPSGDPRVRSFVDAKGRQAKMIRSDDKGCPIVEIDYKDGLELKVERLFAEDGTLLRVRHLRNDTLIKEDILH